MEQYLGFVAQGEIGKVFLSPEVFVLFETKFLCVAW